MYRDRKDTAVTFFLLGALAGMIFAFASCAPPETPAAYCVEQCHE